MPRPNRGPALKWIPKRKTWYVVWYKSGRERLRSTGTADRRQAEEALGELIRERRRNERPDRPRDAEEVLIADMLDLYGAEHAPHAADPARIGYAIDALLPFWGSKRVVDVTKQTCRAYASSRKKLVRREVEGEPVSKTVAIAPATVRRELTTLRAALNFAVQERRLVAAPFVLLPDKPEGKDRWLTRKEAAGLLNAARSGRSDVRLYLPLFIVIALYTGARKDAILSLRWTQVVDLYGDNPRINFADPGARRTSKRKAHIPIPSRLLTFLRLARRRGTDLGYVVHDKGARIKDIGDSVHGSFGGACERAGLVEVTPHTLRHTNGTWLAQSGVDLLKIGQWLGHSDMRTTMLYAHHHPGYQDEARRALDRR